VRLVLAAGVSLRAAPRVLATVSEALGLGLAVPDWTTGRLWLLRLGHAARAAPLLPPRADDWAWLIDHSVQVGPDKCLVILGVRLADLPAPGQCLGHEDMRLVELMPAGRWTRADVGRTLEQVAERTGVVPRVIVDDHGVDLHGGATLFRQQHPGTAEVYDAKHKAACLLKARLGNGPRWPAFLARVGQARCAVQQTELAFLAPPAPRPKARFMNLGPLLRWATRVLAVLRHPPPAVLRTVTVGRLKEKLGWVESFAADVAEWAQWQRVVDAAVALANTHGIDRGAARRLAGRVRGLGPLSRDSRRLAAALVQFVRSQARQARPGERFPGSTEVLESCFGRFKQLEKQQSRGGFTQLLLGFGALLARLTPAAVRDAMRASRTADVKQWAAQTLGITLFAQRKLAFAGATENG
jgi:hypothetical protein